MGKIINVGDDLYEEVDLDETKLPIEDDDAGDEFDEEPCDCIREQYHSGVVFAKRIAALILLFIVCVILILIFL